MKFLYLSLLLLFIGCTSKKSDEVSLKFIPVKQGEYWGYIDQSGKMIISPQFEEAFTFNEGLALVRTTDDKYGFINEKGEYKIPAVYKDAAGFSEGLANVVKENQKVEYIGKDGKTVFTPEGEIEYAYPFKDGMALVKIGNKYGYINRTGKVVIPVQYEEANNFSEGLAMVLVEENEKGKYGFIDKEGKIVITPQFEKAYYGFKEGMAPIKLGNKYGFINKEGKIAITPTYDDVNLFTNGLAAARMGGDLWGFIDKEGKWKINPQFEAVTGFNNSGISGVKTTTNHKWGFINKSGETTIESQFESVLGTFVDGIAITELDDKYGVIGTDGKYKVNPQYERVSLYANNYSRVESDFFEIASLVNLMFDKYNTSSFKEIAPSATFTSLQTKYTNITHDNYTGFTPLAEEKNKYLNLQKIGLYFKEGFYTGGYNDDTPLRAAVFTYSLTDKAKDKQKELLKLLNDKAPKEMQTEYKEGKYLVIHNSNYYITIHTDDNNLYAILTFSKADAMPATESVDSVGN